jgi:hypothetical protein
MRDCPYETRADVRPESRLTHSAPTVMLLRSQGAQFVWCCVRSTVVSDSLVHRLDHPWHDTLRKNHQ